MASKGQRWITGDVSRASHLQHEPDSSKNGITVNEAIGWRQPRREHGLEEWKSGYHPSRRVPDGDYARPPEKQAETFRGKGTHLRLGRGRNKY